MNHARRTSDQTALQRVRKHDARGFTMVEALVALVVLAVGMLGISGLFVVTLRSSGSAISRMNAVNLASDLADRIRANRTGANAYTGAAANNNCYTGAIGTVNCTPAQMAATDLFVWNQQIASTWPGGNASGVVTFANGTPASYTVTITWTDAGDTGALSYQLNFQI